MKVYRCNNCKWEFEEPKYEKEIWYTCFGEKCYQDNYICPLCEHWNFEEIEEEEEDG
jgi:rubredoxin